MFLSLLQPKQLFRIPLKQRYSHLATLIGKTVVDPPICPHCNHPMTILREGSYYAQCPDCNSTHTLYEIPSILGGHK